MTTNELIAQLVSGAILLGFTLVMVLRMRAAIYRRMRELDEQHPASAPTIEQRKIELRTKIDSLQHELNELERGQMSAFRSADAPGID
jgi:hypothetical protein